MRAEKQIKFSLAASMIVFLGSAVLAHAHETGVPTPRDAAEAWNWDPIVITMLSVSFLLYFVGLTRLPKRPEQGIVRRTEKASFFGGWAVLVLSLVGPIHKIGSALFSVHMTQHVLLMLVAAPLLAMGRPLLVFFWALPSSTRDKVADTVRSDWFASSWRAISGPLSVWLVQGVVLWMWHIPVLYDAAVNNSAIHIVQHSMMLLSATLFWWTMVHGRAGRLGYGAAMLYVFLTFVYSGLLSALLVFSRTAWFPIHEGRTAAWNLTPTEDQQLAGLIMWIPAGLLLIGAGLALFAAWLGESENRLKYTRIAESSETAVQNQPGAHAQISQPQHGA
jgi:putative membrane protein